MKRAHSLTESGLLIEQGSTTVVSPDCLRSDNEENVKSMLDLINSDGPYFVHLLAHPVDE